MKPIPYNLILSYLILFAWLWVGSELIDTDIMKSSPVITLGFGLSLMLTYRLHRQKTLREEGKNESYQTKEN